MVDTGLMTFGRLRGWALAAFVLAVSAAALTGCGGKQDTPEAAAGTKQAEAKTQSVTIKDMTFELELALDDDQREQGLSDRKQIAEDGGMLFVFAQPRRTQFVMRRCYVPIDLIYLDDDGYIDSMHEMQVIKPVGGAEWLNPTSGYPSTGAIQFVIELKAGTLDKLGLKRGEKIELPTDRLQSMAQ